MVLRFVGAGADGAQAAALARREARKPAPQRPHLLLPLQGRHKRFSTGGAGGGLGWGAGAAVAVVVWGFGIRVKG